MSAARALSQHPGDQLIRELIATGRAASSEEIARIIERMATAPFSEEIKSVKLGERGISYLGETLGRRMNSLTDHLIKRVVIEQQWVVGTTAEGYVADLHAAVRRRETRLAVYQRRSGMIAVTITPTERALPQERQGEEALPLLLVIYSADRGMIISGYQFTSFAEASIPEEARWLK